MPSDDACIEKTSNVADVAGFIPCSKIPGVLPSVEKPRTLTKYLAVNFSITARCRAGSQIISLGHLPTGEMQHPHC